VLVFAGAGSEELPNEMLALYDATFKNFKEGGLVEGTIVAIQADAIVVDIGYKSEGLIPLSEFNSSEIAALQIGGTLEVYLEEREDGEGNLILSKEKAAKMKVWEVLEQSFTKGEEVSGKMIAKVKGLIRPGDKVMVVLDSDHHQSHVLKEIQLYSPLVTVGSYLIVEDTNINGHPVIPKYGAGPWEAVAEFLRSNRDFVVDETRERYGFTFNPGGWLKRVKS